MPWIYHQSNSRLYRDKTYVDRGWSGHGTGKDNPAMQSSQNVGPLPVGTYTIGQSFNYRRTPKTPHGTGVHSMRLTPSVSNQMFGRSGFLIHGASANPAHHGQESNGCIVIGLLTRRRIATSGDTQLVVVP